jgi:hypothetical protein
MYLYYFINMPTDGCSDSPVGVSGSRAESPIPTAPEVRFFHGPFLPIDLHSQNFHADEQLACLVKSLQSIVMHTAAKLGEMHKRERVQDQRSATPNISRPFVICASQKRTCLNRA